MGFKNDVARVPGLQQAYESGMQALTNPDRKKIRASNFRQIRGSVNVDLALKKSHPGAARWDYVVAYHGVGGETRYWIEFHPAGSGSNIQEIEKKLHWLKSWLKNDGAPLNWSRKVFAWVATGTCAYNLRSPQILRLAQQGIEFKGGCMTMT